jgi:uncharacterized protein (TIGR02145 family)
MKKLLLLTFGLLLLCSCSKKEDEKKEEAVQTPPYAASEETWKFGDQTWSDAIHDPAYDKLDFDGGSSETPKADGRSYTYKKETFYYYSWLYVDENAKLLCPDPWRVPTKSDFEVLKDNITDIDDLYDAWGYGGYMFSTIKYYDPMRDVSTHAYYWSSTKSRDDTAYSFRYGYDGLSVDHASPIFGLQVRCVR